MVKGLRVLTLEKEAFCKYTNIAGYYARETEGQFLKEYGYLDKLELAG